MTGQTSLNFNDIMEKAQPGYKEEQWKKISGSDQLATLNRQQGIEFLKTLNSKKVTAKQYFDAQYNAI